MEPASNLDKAWKFYSHADQILHSRIQSMLIAQAFLIGALAVISVALFQVDPRFFKPLWLLQVLVICMAIAGTLAFIFSNKSIHEKMRSIREKYLDKDPTWQVFMDAYKGWNGAVHTTFPWLSLTFWLLALALTSYFATVRGGINS